jgi:hypothetical protein
LAAPSPSAKPTSITPTPATAARLEVFARRDVRQPDRREPARDVADDRDAVLVEVEQPDGDDAKQHGDQRPRHHRRQLTEADDDGQRGEADEERGPARRAELAEHVPELLEEVPLLLPDTEQLRDLADDDRQGEPDDESLEHGLGDEAREESEPGDPRRERQDVDGDGERRGQRGELVRTRGREVGDGRR